MNFIRKKLHQSFFFSASDFEHITNFMKSTFLSVPLFEKSALQVPVLNPVSFLFSVFLCSVIFFCIGSGCFLSCSEALFSVYFFQKAETSAFLYSESSSLLPGKQVGPPVRADPPETASMRFETSILTLRLGTTPLLLQGNTARKNFSKANRFSHSPSPQDISPDI